METVQGFKVGDTFQLNSISPKMTITNFTENNRHVRVTWLDPANEKYSGTFVIETLVHFQILDI